MGSTFWSVMARHPPPCFPPYRWSGNRFGVPWPRVSGREAEHQRHQDDPCGGNGMEARATTTTASLCASRVSSSRAATSSTSSRACAMASSFLKSYAKRLVALRKPVQGANFSFQPSRPRGSEGIEKSGMGELEQLSNYKCGTPFQVRVRSEELRPPIGRNTSCAEAMRSEEDAQKAYENLEKEMNASIEAEFVWVEV